MIGIEEAPVPPNTDPKIKTFALPEVVRVIRALMNSFNPLGKFDCAASMIDWYIIIDPK